MANEAVLEFTSTKKATPPPYTFWECKQQLQSEFRKINAQIINKLIKLHKGHYAGSHMALRLVMDKINNQLQNNGNDAQASNSGGFDLILKHAGEKRSVSIKCKTLIRQRPCSYLWTDSAELRKEVDKVKEQIKILDEAANRQFALSLLEEDYSKMGQLIECACCFGQCVFDNMTQCTDGHLVCVECLYSYIKEIAFGTGKIVISCMMPECTAEYPQYELTRCLDPKLRSKLEERTLFENLNAAQIKDLVRCPYCDFAAILPHRANRFPCYRDTCGKVTCRNCSGDWEDHVGKTCSMVETRDEVSLRKEFEEKMTRAKVRTCTNCSTEFTKYGGCNKMTCRCGMTMCYVCRKPRKDDERAIQEIRQEASRKRRALGYEGNRNIGVPAAKKRRF